jgi:ABC-2 type transport system permease protein
VLPWSAAAHLALGELAVSTAIGLAAWTAAAYAFGRVQFRRNLRFDSDATRTLGSARGGKVPWASLLYRVPRVLFSDPLAAMIEKDLRSLARAPRFRIVFFMGFSFGAIIWWPVLHDAGHAGVAAVSYPVAVSGYAMLLLAEVAFWNQFGFDRNSAQFYFSAPVPFSRVLLAKNVASMAFVLFEVVLVLLVCTAVRIPLPPSRIAETLGVTLVLALFFLAAGNLNSVYNPRPVNPEHSWGRTAAGRFQVYMLLLFPVMLAPIALAYLAAYAFDSRAALFAVLGFDVLAGAAAYYVASGSAVAAAERRQEEFLGALAQSAGPIVAE